MDFDAKMQEYIDAIDRDLEEFIQPDCPEILLEAVKYSLFTGGKRIRPVILLAVCDMFGGKRNDALPFACALEMIHTYSLIHDDLPALDNDDQRRGKPTNHKVYGEGMALLAGDALLNLAYEVMSNFCYTNNKPHFLRAMVKMSLSAGMGGMIGGQVMDVRLEGAPATAADVGYIYKNKTAKLFEAAFDCGAWAAGWDFGAAYDMFLIGRAVGMAFQLQDDFLDLEADQKIGKPTFAAVLGIEAAKKLHDKYSTEALDGLKLLKSRDGFDSDFLVALVQSLIHRTR